jgi:16S rRNA processing protein RimM
VPEPQAWLHAGAVGAPHGLDGSFHVTRPSASLLHVGAEVTVLGRSRTIERRAGTDQRPIIRIDGCLTREDAQALRAAPLLVRRDAAPALGPDEWWAEDLEGCSVHDGAMTVGTVRRLVALPSCEVLEVQRPSGAPDLLVPLVSDAVRSVDVVARRVEIDLAFLGEE